jgi:hypothetical protein
VDVHPTLPFYASGDVNGVVLLWKEADANVVAQYRVSPAPGTGTGIGGPRGTAVYSAADRISRVRFSPASTTVLAVDNKGSLHTWHTTRPKDPLPVIQVRCWVECVAWGVVSR